MSYILDALRKADAERERGNVPGIHAQPIIGGSAPAATPRAGTPPWPWPWIGMGALALALVLGWFAWRGGSPAAPESRPAPVAVAPVAAAPSPPPVAVAPKEEALPVIRQTRPAAPVPIAPPAALAKTDAKPAAAAAAPAASIPGEARIYALAELPDDVRRQLPALSIGGSAYSKKAADRILIVNGQVLHEGDKVAPDLVLQQIKLRAAVLAFKGYRYEIAY